MAGNWLVLNSKEILLNGSLNNECLKLLKSLKWNNPRVSNGIPKWLEKWRWTKQTKLEMWLKRLSTQLDRVKNWILFLFLSVLIIFNFSGSFCCQNINYDKSEILIISEK